MPWAGILGCTNSKSVETNAVAGETPWRLMRPSIAFTKNGKDFRQNSTDAKARPLQTRRGPVDDEWTGRRSPNGPIGAILLANPCKSKHLHAGVWPMSW
jgi:hypothetical protein